uniref:Chemokine interleukin-8-like domain-containing protein n=1 Tax=Oreochromis aureus TaxID=47969 RepID=A0AAZ1XAT9_OREAU
MENFVLIQTLSGSKIVSHVICKMSGVCPTKAPVRDETLNLFCHTRICSYPQSNPSDTRGGPGSKRPCCVNVTKDNVSADVVGQTYREQAARHHCVKAIIFNTKNGKQLCADPDAQWVKDLTAKMRKV